jgi:hypothetical protein
MKALTVNETINFERGQDPIKAMGVGIVNKKNFDTMEDLVNYLIYRIPDILKTNEIPSDIINQPGKIIRSENPNYYEMFKSFLIQNDIKLKGEPANDYNVGLEMRWNVKLREKLRKMGFEIAEF